MKINQATKDKMVHIWNENVITSRDMLLFILWRALIEIVIGKQLNEAECWIIVQLNVALSWTIVCDYAKHAELVNQTNTECSVSVNI